MYILGIETSCDETAAAVVEDGSVILSNVVSTQIELHRKWGGIVPEIASRAHIENIMPVLHEALLNSGKKLSDMSAVAVTMGPGLMAHCWSECRRRRLWRTRRSFRLWP